MKSNLIAIMLVLLAKQADAQPAQTIAPFKPAEVTAPQQPPTNQNLGDLNKVLGPTPAPASGVIYYFDYTRLLQWLIPKKHPKIPQECDPNFFLNDSIPAAPVIKKDSVTKPPV